jgi:uncharacterized protein YuzE
MRVDYDLDAGAMYIALTERSVHNTITVDDETLIDLDEDGAPVGIEVIGLSRAWPLNEVIMQFGPKMDPFDIRQLVALFPVGGGARRVTPEITAERPVTLSTAG